MYQFRYTRCSVDERASGECVTIEMPSLRWKYDRYGLLILDTGPIRELLLHHAVFQFRFERLRPELRCLRTPASYARCSQFIGSFNRKTTSASVVSELNHWIRDTEAHGQERLCHRAYEEFRSMQLNEEVIRLVVMDIEMVVRFGPVDASLIELARRHQTEHPLVLTVDSKLCGQCLKAGFSVRLLQELWTG